MSSKSKSSASEGSNNKSSSSPATPRVSKLGNRVGAFKSDADSPSPIQKAHLSVDRSPRSVTSKPRPTRPTTAPDKQPTRVVKGPELQAQLTAVQEDLKKANKKLTFSEKEKAKALEEAKEAKKQAEEAKEMLREALAAQKRAEEDSEIEKFRALEIEQVTIDTDQKRDEKWQKELESIRHQHALDLSALISTTEELQRVKQELAITTDTKNQALTHAEDATKIAEIHAEKMEILSAELARVKASMESRLDNETNEKNELISQLNTEVNNRKIELEKIKIYEVKLAEMENCIEQVNVELEAAKMAQSYNRNLAEEWMEKADALEVDLKESNRVEKSVSENLELVSKKLEESNSLLQVSEIEISSLNKKMESLETSINRQRDEIEESEFRVEMAKGEAADMAKKIECLVSELEVVKEKNIQSLNNEKIAVDNIRNMLEEKNNLEKEFEKLSDENEKNKQAMESLTAALHEVSIEAREVKEKLLSSQEENKKYESEIENLKFNLKSTSESYESMICEAKNEIDILNKSIEMAKDEYQSSKEEWEKKELNFMNCVKQSEEERASLEREISRLMTFLREKEEKVFSMEEEGALMANKLTEAQSEIICLKEALGEANEESVTSKDILVNKENEIQNLIRENEELRTRESASLKKIDDLSKLLEESMVKKENGEVSDCEKDYDLLPKVVEFSEKNGNCKENKSKNDGNDNLSDEEVESVTPKFGNLNGKKEDKKENKAIQMDSRVWESCKIEENDFSTEKSLEQESLEGEEDSKVHVINRLSSGETQENGETSPLEQQNQKKKKPLLKKFGSLLKKKGTNNTHK